MVDTDAWAQVVSDGARAEGGDPSPKSFGTEGVDRRKGHREGEQSGVASASSSRANGITGSPEQGEGQQGHQVCTTMEASLSHSACQSLSQSVRQTLPRFPLPQFTVNRSEECEAAGHAARVEGGVMQRAASDAEAAEADCRQEDEKELVKLCFSLSSRH